MQDTDNSESVARETAGWGLAASIDDPAAGLKPVPEPPVYALLGLGLVALLWRRRSQGSR